jgi:hypothetical protein
MAQPGAASMCIPDRAINMCTTGKVRLKDNNNNEYDCKQDSCTCASADNSSTYTRSGGLYECVSVVAPKSPSQFQTPLGR